MEKKFKETQDYRVYTIKSEVHKAANTLVGIINGINMDGIIKDKEVHEIINWCNLHRHLETKSPFSEIIPVITKALSDNHLDFEEIEDILWICQRVTNEDEFGDFYNLVTTLIQQLEGILHGILADNELSEEEIKQLANWIEENDILKGTYPFDEIDSLLINTLKDGVISDDEKSYLTGFFANFIDTRISYNLNEFDLKELQKKYSINGICAVSPDISFENKTFCFTGTSNKGTRNEIAKVILENGGLFNNNVTQKTDYLVIGGEGNPCWAFTCYGRKVEKAVQMRKNGNHIVIVHENDFWDETY